MVFGADGVFGNFGTFGSNNDLYATTVSIDNPPDNSQYTDAGQDPTAGGGGDWASTLGNVVNDAFKAFQISQTPTTYRAASPNSPAAIQARAAATTSQQRSQLFMIGVIVVVGIIIFLLVRK